MTFFITSGHDYTIKYVEEKNTSLQSCISFLSKSTGCYLQNLEMLLQGLHRLEKYLNIQYCLEKSLKIKFALKST